MQAIYMYKDKGDSSGRTDLMDAVIHTGRISGHLEEECVRRSGGRTIRIWDSGEIFGRYKKGVWRRRWGVNKGSRTIEARIGKQDDGGICVGI